MAEAVPGTFTYNACRMATRRRRGLDKPPKLGNSASGARHRFEQRRRVQQVDAINALALEVAASVKPRNDVSEDEELALKTKRGLAATFEFEQRNRFSRLLMAKMKNQRPLQTSLHDPEGLGEYERPSMGKQWMTYNKTSAEVSFPRTERQQLQALERGDLNDTMIGRHSGLGKQVLSQCRSAPSLSLYKDGDRFKKLDKRRKHRGSGPDFMLPPSSLGYQVLSDKRTASASMFAPIPKLDYNIAAALETPGPGTYPGLGLPTPTIHLPNNPSASIRGKWSNERANPKDLIAAAAVGPGCYDDLIPNGMSGIGGRQRETYKRNAPVVRVGPPPDPLLMYA